jgi:hypothetical protein
MTTHDDTDEILEEWANTLVAELAIRDLPVDVRSVLSLAGVAAHSVVRPAAPLTTFLAGYAAGIAAAGNAVTPAEATATAIATARRAIAARSDGSGS